MGRVFNERAGTRTARWASVVLVGVLLLGGGRGEAQAPESSRTYATRTGEIRPVTLSDGSLAHLNTRTRLEWLADAEQRQVILHEGEAYFEVAPDAARPFRVQAARGEIEALGARFTVYKQASGQVVLTVLEGELTVAGPARESRWRRELKTNQCLSYSEEGLLQEAASCAISPRVVSWREQMLHFAHESLPQVLEELQRYTDKRLIIADERLNRLRMGGMIRPWSIKQALFQLERLAPIVVREHNDAYELSYRDSH